MLARLAAAATLLALLAGCSDSPSTAGGADAATPGGDAATTGAAGTYMPDADVAPEWRAGQWWDHHWYLGAQDTTGFTVKSIVVEAGASSWRLATDREDNAASHAAFFFNDLGAMGRDWVLRDASYAFPWYQFPLHDGKTWTAQEENLDFNLQPVSRSLTVTARAVNGTGTVPDHFVLEARDDGELRARYDYRPDIGWFSLFEGFSPDVTGDGEPETYRVEAEAWGGGWTGAWYAARGDFLLNHFSGVFPAGAQAHPNPQASFAVREDHTHVLAIVYSFAAAGASAAELVAPDGQHWEAYVAADHEGSAVGPWQQPFVFVPAVVGDWRLATAGAGGFAAGGGGYAWGVTMESGTL